MTLHCEIMNIPCEPIAGTESEVLAFKLGHKQALHAAAELADKQLIGHAPFHDRPVGEPYMLPTMHAPSIINRHYPEDSESAALMELKLKDMVDQHRQNTADAYVNAMDDHVVIVMSGIDEEPASLSKAMKFLESKEVQTRREQKLRDDVAALKNDLGLACALLDRTAKLMKAAEWLYSSDTGENGFAASVTYVRRTAMIRAHAAFASAEAIREGPYK